METTEDISDWFQKLSVTLSKVQGTITPEIQEQLKQELGVVVEQIKKYHPFFEIISILSSLRQVAENAKNAWFSFWIGNDEYTRILSQCKELKTRLESFTKSTPQYKENTRLMMFKEMCRISETKKQQARGFQSRLTTSQVRNQKTAQALRSLRDMFERVDDRLQSAVRLQASEQRAQDARLNRVLTHDQNAKVITSQAMSEEDLLEQDIQLESEKQELDDEIVKLRQCSGELRKLEQLESRQQASIALLEDRLKQDRTKNPESPSNDQQSSHREHKNYQLSDTQYYLVTSVLTALSETRQECIKLLYRDNVWLQIESFRRDTMCQLTFTTEELHRKMDILQKDMDELFPFRGIPLANSQSCFKYHQDFGDDPSQVILCWKGGVLRSKIQDTAKRNRGKAIIHCCELHVKEVHEYFQDQVSHEVFHWDTHKHWIVSLSHIV